MKQDAALRSWLAHPSPKTRAMFLRAVERALKSSKHVASVAVGRRRLEVRRAGDTWTIVDPKTDDAAAFVKKERRTTRLRVHNGETPSQFKRRMSAQQDRDNRKRATVAAKKKRAELSTKAKQARSERTGKLAGARTTCKAELDTARKSHPKQPGRRVALARTRVHCAERAHKLEEDFAQRLGVVEGELEKLRAERRRPPRRHKAAKRRVTPGQRIAERDDAMRAELERRGLAHLVPVWDRERKQPRFRNLSFDWAIERFMEFLEEDPEATTIAQTAAEQIDPGAMECEQAQHFAEQGDPTAAAWAQEHCEEGRPRRKTSAASRTVSMFHGIAPPAEPQQPQKRSAKGKPEKRGPLRGQQTLGASRFGRSVLDQVGPQTLL